VTQPSDDTHGTILLIDDEGGVRRLVQRLLERLGYSVIPTDNGQAGIEAFNAFEPGLHAVLLDLNMPNMDGIETFRQLQQAGCEAPIFIISGYDEKSLQLDLPVNGYVAKPIDFTDLEKQLAACQPGS